MGVYEKLNQHRRITTVVAALVCVCAIVAIGLDLFNDMQGRRSSPKAFFSRDDGKTWYSGSAEILPTADDGSNPAYIATVFTCNGGKQFVGYLLRYTVAGKKMALDADKVPQRMPSRNPMLLTEIEVKRPNETTWVKESDPAAGAIMTVRCPDNGRFAELVAP
jgi:hypothetical protein